MSVDRLFHLWLVDFVAVGYEIKGLRFIFNLHPPEPPATTGQTAAPRRPRPAVRRPTRPENTPHRRSAAAALAIPLGPPVPNFFSDNPHATAPPTPATTAPILNPKIDSRVPLRRAPLPTAAGSSFTPASPPLKID